MSYSRCKDERYWRAFSNALMCQHTSLTAEGLVKARDHNFYSFSGHRPLHAGRGLCAAALLTSKCCPISCSGYVHGSASTNVDAGIYGFIANIFFYDIETLLKMVQEKKLKVLIDKVFPLKDAAEALRVIEEREVFGKVVVAP